MAAHLLSSIILLFSLIHVTHAALKFDLIARTCTNVHARNSSEYIKNYVKIQNDMFRDGSRFKDNAEGNPPNKLYVSADCTDYIGGTLCDDCRKQASSYLAGCFPSTGGVVLLDDCFMQADNYSFFTDQSITSFNLTRCGMSKNNTSPEFENAVKIQIQKMKTEAPNQMGWSNGYVNNNGTLVFGVAKCWPWHEHNATHCAKCLERAALSALSCLPSTDGRTFQPNAQCYLRYSDKDIGSVYRTQHKRKVIIPYDSYIHYILKAVVASIFAILVGFFGGKIIFRPSQMDQPDPNAL